MAKILAKLKKKIIVGTIVLAQVVAMATSMTAYAASSKIGRAHV